MDELIEYCSRWQAGRFDLPYAVDGLVIKVNSLPAGAAGFHHEKPPLGHSLQVSPEQAVTRVKNILSGWGAPAS